MPRLLILKTGSTYPAVREQFGDFERWFVRELDRPDETAIHDVTRQPPPGSPSDWQGILVTGSPAMVTDREPWSERAAAWLAEAVAAEVPVLGVCYGHQLLVHALGGQVGYREPGRESGTFEVRLTPGGEKDPLLGQLPAVFPAHLTHAQSVLELPPEGSLLANSAGEPNQAFRIGRHAWGLQFHPEFTEQVMTAYLKTQADALRAQGQDPDQLLASVRPTPDATSLLRRFVGYVDALGHK